MYPLAFETTGPIIKILNSINHGTISEKKPFNKRAFISTALFVSGLILPFSGYMNHILQFDVLSFEKHLWMSVHNVAGILFAIFVILHVSFNRGVLLNYAKKAKKKFVSKETIYCYRIGDISCLYIFFACFSCCLIKIYEV